MLEMLKSITEKIKSQKNKKINELLSEKIDHTTIDLILFTLLILFSANNTLDYYYLSNQSEITFYFLLLAIFIGYGMLIFNFTKKIINLFTKKKLFNILNKEEEDFFKKEKIEFKNGNFLNLLFNIQKICINNINSEKELKELIIFILNDTELDNSFKKNIMTEIKDNKYFNDKLVELLYADNISELNDDTFFINEIYTKINLQQIIKYKKIETLLNEQYVVEKMFSEFKLNRLVKIILEKEINKIEDGDLYLYNFLNNLEVKKLVNIKELILNKFLSEGNIKDINGYEEEFFVLSNKLKLNGNLLYVMEEELKKNEISINIDKKEDLSLRIINI